jgi:S-adenosyl-L-methionine hydrolase (adenosine-forming)
MSNASPAVITFLSDYGYGDEFVGVCHGVIARRCPGASVIDITHGIPRHDVRLGALALRSALPYMPSGIHLAIVDPGVGAVGEDGRRAVALRTIEQARVLIGPDNGLLAAASELFGGVAEAVDIGRSPERLEPISATFHGRDIFAPVAGALADGAQLAEVGDPLAATDLRELPLPTAHRDGEWLRAHVLHADHFGNLILDATQVQISEIGLRLGGQVEIELAGATHTARYASTFADVPAHKLLLYEDAQQMMALAVNRGSAERLLDAGSDCELSLRRSGT